MHTHEMTIRVQHTDAGGVVFFGNYFSLFHEAYEDLMAAQNVPIHNIIGGKDLALPVVHSTGDFKAPLFAGDRVSIGVSVKNIGEHSFTLIYEISKEGQVVSTGETVHVALDPVKKEKIVLPDTIKQALENVQ